MHAVLGRKVKQRNPWWTRERCIAAGALFYQRKQIAPTSEDWWRECTQFTAKTADGASNRGETRDYPSTGPLKNFWKGMREFWRDVAGAHPELNVFVDKGDAPWSPLEEWWITESVGLIPRTEVARLMEESGCGRTEPAIKRRLYELGVNSHNRWGWTVSHLASVIGVSEAVIYKYIDHGKLPCLQGNKCIYLEPADFFVIQEYDWSKKRHPRELEQAVRKSLMQRLCYIAAGFDFRKFSYHKLQPRTDLFTGRIKNPRSIHPPPPARPSHVRVGDWVKILHAWAKQPGAQGRIGRVVNLVWSPVARRRTQKTPAREACWVVTVDFPKLKAHGQPDKSRVRYSVPASSVEKVRKPSEEKRELLPQRPRPNRKARMQRVGAEVLATRLNIQSSIQAERITATFERGQHLSSHNLNLPPSPVDVRSSRRGERSDLPGSLS
jgi:hypothetical protein